MRCSIEASEVWSSSRVAPRSVMVVVAVSAMIVADVCGVGLDRRRAGDVADGAEAHRDVSTMSPSFAGVSGVTGCSRPFLRTTCRAVGEVDRRQFRGAISQTLVIAEEIGGVFQIGRGEFKRHVRILPRLPP